jgi:hypothetical protein
MTDQNYNMDQGLYITRDLWIGHLGIIAKFFHKFNLISFINELLPNKNMHNATYGECLLCLVMVALTNNTKSQHKIIDQIEDWPLFLLFNRRDLEAKDFNVEALGGFLDAVADYGLKNFFAKVVKRLNRQAPDLIQMSGLQVDIAHLNIHSGYDRFKIIEYNSSNSVNSPLNDINDNFERLDLLIIFNKHGIPILVDVLSDNNNDSSIKNLLRKLKFSKNIYYIDDGAFWPDSDARKFGFRWIANAPQSVKERRELISMGPALVPLESDPRRSFYEKASPRWDAGQKWFLFDFSETPNQDEMTYDRLLDEEMAAGYAALKKLSSRPFESREEALREAYEFITDDSLKRLSFRTLEIEVRAALTPEKVAPPLERGKPNVKYFISGKLAFDQELVDEERRDRERFVLATNDMNLTPEEILKRYQERSRAEKGFRFLKGRELRVPKALLRGPKRVRGFCGFMGIALMAHSILERLLRQGLEENGKFLFDKNNKYLIKPTLDEAFATIDNINGIVTYEKPAQLIKFDAYTSKYVNTELLKIINAYGTDYIEFYRHSTGNLRVNDANFLYKYMKKYDKKIYKYKLNR